MRKRRQYADDMVSKSKGGRATSVAAFKRPADNPLAIPKIANEVVESFSETSGFKLLSQVALNFLDTGEIPDTATGPTKTILADCLKKWVYHHAPTLLENDCDLGVSFTRDPVSWSDMAEEVEEGQWQFAIDMGTFDVFEVKEGIEELNLFYEGLGKTALHLIEAGGARTLDIFSPGHARFMCEYLYWYGQDNQEDFVEELKGFLDDEEDLQESLEATISPIEFDGSFDSWVINPSMHVKEDALKQLLAQTGEGYERDVVQLMVDINQMLSDGYELPDFNIENHNAYFGHSIVWENGDLLGRILDDHINQANEASDSYTSYLLHCSAPSDLEGFAKWKTGMENGLNLYQSVDRLIKLVGKLIN